MFICVSDWLLDSGLTLTHSFRKHCGSSWTHGDAWGRMGTSELLQERLQFSEFLTRLPSLRRCRITRKQSFLFFVLTPKALRQWKFVLVCVCVSWKPFLFQQHRIVNSNLKPWYFLFMFVNWMGALELEFETKKGYH